MDTFRIRPISEADIDQVVEAAGGRRAHLDADQRSKPGADYLLGDCVLELKVLDEDGLRKSERQRKLADIFRPVFPDRPVIVLDRALLTPVAQRKYDRALEGPIKTAIGSAKGQLRQSRVEYPEAQLSVLWIVNNGYTALDDEALRRMLVHRVRNDSTEIDGVVVSGCYFHSDTFDSYFIWPIHYEPIRLDRSFATFERLKAAWDDLATQHMTELMRQPPGERNTKGPVLDAQFEVDGVTFVKPAPPLGNSSAFFLNGRPRVGAESFPPVARVFGDLTPDEWSRFTENEPALRGLGHSYGDWSRERVEATQSGTILQPLVSLPVTFEGWREWSRSQPHARGLTLHHYAHVLFNARMQKMLQGARDLRAARILPSRYMRVLTEEIGQDRGNDVSHAAVVTSGSDGEQHHLAVFSAQRIFHEQAVALACAYAFLHDIEVVMWEKDLRYAWV